jgi:hypothetical protein
MCVESGQMACHDMWVSARELVMCVESGGQVACHDMWVSVRELCPRVDTRLGVRDDGSKLTNQQNILPVTVKYRPPPGATWAGWWFVRGTPGGCSRGGPAPNTTLHTRGRRAPQAPDCLAALQVSSADPEACLVCALCAARWLCFELCVCQANKGAVW